MTIVMTVGDGNRDGNQRWQSVMAIVLTISDD
jgi:hypothetical protein